MAIAMSVIVSSFLLELPARQRAAALIAVTGRAVACLGFWYSYGTPKTACFAYVRVCSHVECQINQWFSSGQRGSRNRCLKRH
jgi:hypothetical protein